jgi:predicted metal-dependent hydrolase
MACRPTGSSAVPFASVSPCPSSCRDQFDEPALAEVIAGNQAPVDPLHRSDAHPQHRGNLANPRSIFTAKAKRQAILEEWHRTELKKAIPTIIAKWESLVGVKVERFFIQKMKTKWGSCNPATKSIRLNAELAKKPVECLEYIVLHEMAHLIVRRHDHRFSGLMDHYLANWRHIQQTLNEAPFSHAEWGY